VSCYSPRACEVFETAIPRIPENTHIAHSGSGEVNCYGVVVAVKVAAEVVICVKSNGLPNCNTVNVHIGGEFEIDAVIVRYTSVHHLGNVGQLLGVLD